MEGTFARKLEGGFVSGGTVPLESPSYIERVADRALFEALSAGKFCYVLNSRQMGGPGVEQPDIRPAVSHAAGARYGRARAMNFQTLPAQADRDDGPFGDHLKRILVSVSQLPEVLEAVRSSLEIPPLRDADGFHRLVPAGVMYRAGANKIAFACDLYRRYLQMHLSP